MSVEFLRQIAATPLPSSFTAAKDIDASKILRQAGLVLALSDEPPECAARVLAPRIASLRAIDLQLFELVGALHFARPFVDEVAGRRLQGPANARRIYAFAWDPDAKAECASVVQLGMRRTGARSSGFDMNAPPSVLEVRASVGMRRFGCLLAYRTLPSVCGPALGHARPLRRRRHSDGPSWGKPSSLSNVGTRLACVI